MKRKQIVNSNRSVKRRKMGATASQHDDKNGTIQMLNTGRQNKLSTGKHIPFDTLEGYGYHFKNDKFVSIETDEPFQFDVFTDSEENQKRYESIGKLVDQAVFDMLEHDCQLTRVTVPIDAKRGELTSFVFISKNITTAKFLMIIIHGTGAVQAGQWSRKLIINESLTVGSQIAYIKRAQSAGYAVIVTNTNLNQIKVPRVLRFQSVRSIRGSHTAEEHGCYVWKHIVHPSSIQHICIMAHSYGGAVVLEMARSFEKEFKERIFAIALTDSPVAIYGRRMKKSVLSMLKEKTINWVVDTETVDTDLGEDDCCLLRSAGHPIHEWTSHCSIDAIFDYFSQRRLLLK